MAHICCNKAGINTHTYVHGINTASSSVFQRRYGSAAPSASCPEVRSDRHWKGSHGKTQLQEQLVEALTPEQTPWQRFQWKSVHDLKKIYQNHATKEQASISQLDHTSQEDPQVWLFIPSSFFPTRALLDVSFPFGSIIKIPDFFVPDMLLKRHFL